MTPKASSALAWAAAAALSVLCFAFQNRTGPTYPLEGRVETARGPVAFKLLRSEEIGNDLALVLPGPVPAGLAAQVRYRRYRSHDGWSTQAFAPGTFRLSRRGVTEEVKGLGATLPSLSERAGKYEFLVDLEDGTGWRSITGEQPVYARYKAPVPRLLVLVHVLVIFLSLTFGLRTAIEALRGREVTGLLRATIASFFLGAFVLGPAMQQFAFGVLWSGWPFGHDWTDNKVVVELLAWVAAAVVAARYPARARAAVLTAAAVMLLVYFIPHSIFGSEFDYTRGAGHGTAG
ncbi:MAG: hypothetical protein QM704_12310 [Anaeromyxobacteraceae bacterium]